MPVRSETQLRDKWSNFRDSGLFFDNRVLRQRSAQGGCAGGLKLVRKLQLVPQRPRPPPAMLVDNPIQHSFTPPYNPASLDEFLNLELFGGSSNPIAGSSGSSPRSSPSNSFTGLPPTPPEPFSINVISLSPSPFFSISQDDDLSKMSSFVPPATTAAGYDFLASYSQMAQMSSPESSGSGTFSSSGDSPGSIDPQLMHTPAGEKPASEFDEEEEGDEDDFLNDHDDLQSIPEDHVLPQMKVGGKGKANRKGTVRDGGVTKRAVSVEKENKQPAMLSTTSLDPDDWRPTPEEYKKMSSKEKRQLRNKISARNFRVRRKGASLLSSFVPPSRKYETDRMYRVHHHARGRYRRP